MPLYEYECQSCHRRIEKIQKFSDPPLEVCPHCGGKLEKLISSPAFHLKGSGWYVTDYARKTGEPGKSDKSDGPDKSEKSDKSEKPDTAKSTGADGSAASDKAGKSAEPAAKSSAESGAKGSSKTT